MAFYKRLNRIFSRDAAQARAIVHGTSTSRVFQALFGTDSIYDVPAVTRCTDIIANCIAALPLEFQERQRGTFRVSADHPYTRALTIQPNPDISARDFISALIRDLLVSGRSYIIPRYIGADVRFYLCNPAMVDYDSVRHLYRVSETANNIAGEYDEDGLIVIRNKPRSFVGNPSAITSEVANTHKRTISTARELDDEAYIRAHGGGTRVIISGKGIQTGMYGPHNSELDSLASKLSSYFDNRASVIATPSDIDITQLGATSQDMQFQAMREFAVVEICRIFGVPPMLVYSAASSNYKTVDMAQQDFMDNTINPILHAIENELNRKLIPSSRWGVCRFRFNRASRQLTNPDARAKYFSSMLAMGAMTPNEIRAELGLSPVENGDNLMITANLQPLNPPNDNANRK